MRDRCEDPALLETTRRMEHSALAPLGVERIGAWLDEVGEAVAGLERSWAACAGDLPPKSATYPLARGEPSLASARARNHELRMLGDEIRALRRRLADGAPPEVVVARAWPLRDRLVFASVEIRILDEAYRHSTLSNEALSA